MICDANDGERYGIHFGSGHYVDTADQHLDLQMILEKYATVTLDMEPAKGIGGFEVTDKYRRMMESYEGLETYFMPVFTALLCDNIRDRRALGEFTHDPHVNYGANKRRFIHIFSKRFSTLCQEGNATAIRSFLESTLAIEIDDVRDSLLMGFDKQSMATALSLIDGESEELPGRMIAAYADIRASGGGGDFTSGVDYLKEAGVLEFGSQTLPYNPLEAHM